ncbi:unnamed protein product [Calypogeia fissa]
MALSLSLFLQVGAIKLTRGKDVGLSSSRFIVSTRVQLISSRSSRLRVTSTGFKVGASSLSNSSQAEDERVKEGDGGASFLKMWERAKQKNVEDDREDWARREKDFQSMLQIPKEERDRVQRMQVVDRAAAALAAVNALLSEYPNAVPQQQSSNQPSNGTSPTSSSSSPTSSKWIPTSVVEVRPHQLSRPREAEVGSASSVRSGFEGSPGPEFWSWVPPENGTLQPLKSGDPGPKPKPSVLEKDRTSSSLSLPFETEALEEPIDLPSMFQNRAMPSLPPLQSLLEVDKEKIAGIESATEVQPIVRMPSIDTETASAVNQELHHSAEVSSGVHEDGSRWWQETGVEERENGVLCKWTLIRGVSGDEGTEWQEKFWEASDAFDYKELGAEKSGRDSYGRVWHEFWRESMWQDAANGLQHMEKTADKWGKDASGGEWRERWFEHYDASGCTEKWADKWSRIDSDTPLEPGHAHTWRERWGERFDGQGSAMKYTDKWAERKEYGDSWTKLGDKWDERFDPQGHGVKQGETWWEGINGEKWNRTWGEGHNGTGWVHKYGKSSSGEHWDTHAEEPTWYERRPHFGFRECFDNSQELRKVNERRNRQL